MEDAHGPVLMFGRFKLDSVVKHNGNIVQDDSWDDCTNVWIRTTAGEQAKRQVNDIITLRWHFFFISSNSARCLFNFIENTEVNNTLGHNLAFTQII